MGPITIMATFSDNINLCKEILWFEVLYFVGTYHAIFGWPCYVKFMIFSKYAYRNIKMSSSRDVIRVTGNL
jgi:hypothetical protein